MTKSSSSTAARRCLSRDVAVQPRTRPPTRETIHLSSVRTAGPSALPLLLMPLTQHVLHAEDASGIV
ncbi:hypothetical protein BDA96_05G078200 [Sorghum bicolor]|uniref:Uncharacterized protein n=2 Tax=Sorghum bicolor TaxID=4558 RepID=A0A921QY14_SORBI|nr:hypothetical protein BDA96_05G078200 [Sorghum bicolor]OQU83102.1 hypothetical protein SORBI_3005G077466 [Sorghum bicolor]